jgi:hypothetical protein
MKPLSESQRTAAVRLGIGIGIAALLGFAWGYSNFGPIFNR